MEKEKARVVKTGKGFEILDVPAYTGTVKNGNLKLQGWSKVTVPTANEQGLAFLRKNLTDKDVTDIRRQRVTDAKNNVRTVSEVTLKTKVGRAVKAHPELEAKLEKILAELESK